MICGEVIEMEPVTGEWWLTLCGQPPDHEGPHGGPVSWEQILKLREDR